MQPHLYLVRCVFYFIFYVDLLPSHCIQDGFSPPSFLVISSLRFLGGGWPLGLAGDGYLASGLS